jgi:hypothetical protein
VVGGRDDAVRPGQRPARSHHHHVVEHQTGLVRQLHPAQQILDPLIGVKGWILIRRGNLGYG